MSVKSARPRDVIPSSLKIDQRRRDAFESCSNSSPAQKKPDTFGGGRGLPVRSTLTTSGQGCAAAEYLARSCTKYTRLAGIGYAIGISNRPFGSVGVATRCLVGHACSISGQEVLKDLFPDALRQAMTRLLKGTRISFLDGQSSSRVGRMEPDRRAISRPAG